MLDSLDAARALLPAWVAWLNAPCYALLCAVATWLGLRIAIAVSRPPLEAARASAALHWTEVARFAFGVRLTILLVSAGAVDVAVTGPRIEGVADQAYTYLEDRTGWDGLLGVHSYTRSIGYAAAEGEGGYTSITLIDGGVLIDIHDFIGPEGACIAESPAGKALAATDLGVGWLTLTSSEGQALDLEWDEGSGSFYTPLEAFEDYGEGSSWTLSARQGTWPAFAIEDALLAARTSSFTSPSLSTGEPLVTRDQTFTWTPRDGAWMLLFMSLSIDDWFWGWEYDVQSMRCLLPNNGSWTTPDGTWSTWPGSWDSGYVAITYGEVRLDRGKLPDGSATTWLSASMLAAGAYTIQ